MLDAYKELAKIAYTRVGGSPQECECAEYLKERIESFNVEVTLEEFPVCQCEIAECSLKVVAPYEREIACRAYVGCGNGDIEAECYYLRDPSNLCGLAMLRNKIVIIQGYLRHWIYKDIVEAGALAIVVADGHYIAEDLDIDSRELRAPLQEFGLLPIVQINIKDLFELIHSGSKRLHLKLQISNDSGVSRNVVARIPGELEETIVFTAHYDSTALSKGAWDNGSGVVAILKLIEHFAAHKPRHSCVFVLCGSEERGLLGSKAFVVAHEAELAKYGFCINIDMIGSVVAKLVACVTAEADFAGYLNCFARLEGKSLEVYRDVYSSDSTPFADAGVPAMSFGQHGSVTPIHCRYDDMDIVDEAVLNEDIAFIIKVAQRLADGKILPMKRLIPDDMKEKLDYYLARKRK